MTDVIGISPIRTTPENMRVIENETDQGRVYTMAVGNSFSPKNLSVTASADGLVTIRGGDAKGDGETYRVAQAFERSFKIPDDVSADHLSAMMRDGQVVIQMPKKSLVPPTTDAETGTKQEHGSE
mmetsp:Transcript_5366/g.7489  ORF Transcript_5366/g.7489 Transcript_5366/m.7489 type:complete len:125 (-) Transcript_5366:260-634(-)|eukprot:CAMPEP_0184489634 /NCGR_PEP_ID=MMETSP0113_2-20130426/15987_1 /TAXON_ID=91329 /ORGANISM="Norrisiella sphaerica, Strain BC52" /LENGTH=124 /DNA_ID=CAMNT_0026873171 /DNA_START=197 /DNA_END=571 /DNA_ORIENTATION=-